ncbi:MAG: lamin tail domain-containing protein [Bacteroidetes bacterium]|jgi:hypothetical protein|nr:lamin tail domain-containing protein [Bacteroidota bacterium]
MKSILTAIGVLLCVVTARAQFIENFDDGDFAGWTGIDTGYIVNASNQLQLHGNCSTGGTEYLSYPLATLDSAVWSFYVDLQFDPSSANHTRIFLQSNTPVLNGDVYGYFVRIGEDGLTDRVELWRSNGATASLMIEGTSDMSLSPTVGVKVVRTNDAEWQLYVDPTGGTDYVLEGTDVDDTYNGGNYFGFYSKYSSTRCELFFYDDIFIDPPFVDDVAPEIVSLEVLSSTQLTLTFNEPVTLESAETESFYVVDEGVGNPIDATRDVVDFSKVVLTFLSAFPEGVTLTLTVNDVADENGNLVDNATQSFSIYTTQEYDLLIDEIFADIEPQVGLPLGEYVELYNNTDVEIDLVGFQLHDATSESDAFTNYIIPAGGYVVLVDDGVADLFSAYANVLVVTGLPSLNNDGDDLQLISPEGTVIHAVNYKIDWYGNAVKEDGGWSLEMIDTNNPCQEKENWKAAIDANGGTPGLINSVAADNPDETAPALIEAYPIGLDTVITTFDEKIILDGLSTSNFTITTSSGETIIPTALIIDPNNAFIVGLKMPTTLLFGIIYTVSATGISDCSGNEINLFNQAIFGLPEPALANDVVINEVLFNPISEGVDFVEIYNRSAKIIDLSTLIIAEMDLFDTTEVNEYDNISLSGRLLLPGQYLCLSSDPDLIAAQYFSIDTGNFLTVNELPNYADNEGIVAILDNTLNEIDRLHFFDDWHYALLSNQDGVSLERINYDYTTQDNNNWFSAASDVHFATPGYQNSNFGAYTSSGTVAVSSPVFSPDGDGFNDLMVITYSTETEGFTGRFQIFSAQGKLVKDLTGNITLSREGFITWDGLNNDDQKASSGIYILYAELFDLEGNVKSYKLKSTLVRKQ